MDRVMDDAQKVEKGPAFLCGQRRPFFSEEENLAQGLLVGVYGHGLLEGEWPIDGKTKVVH